MTHAEEIAWIENATRELTVRAVADACRAIGAAAEEDYEGANLYAAAAALYQKCAEDSERLAAIVRAEPGALVAGFILNGWPLPETP